LKAQTVDSQGKKSNLLSSLRALDLTDERGFLCGKILGDLGVDVIKIEKPGGDPSREIGPFYHDQKDPQKSLYWFAYNNNKRGITLNLEVDEGQKIFKTLVKNADFLIESFHPGYLDNLGLNYKVLSKINPRIILVSITHFGITGPYKDYQASDLICMSMGGLAYLTGSSNGTPVRINFPQSFLLASAHAAAAAMVAHYYRQKTGEGQHVDVSAQSCIAGILANAMPLWELNHTVLKRQGPYMIGRGTTLKIRLLWPCKDGYVSFFVMGGKFGVRDNQRIAKWIADVGMAPDFYKKIDWSSLDMAKQTQEEQDRIDSVIAQFFLKHTMAEIYELAHRDGVMITPLSSFKDISQNSQLQSRNYWLNVEHPELGENIMYPGATIKITDIPYKIQHRAPLIGEHNNDIYKIELGLSSTELNRLKHKKVI
jgi:benzylsuccinate CoA-transferase BbsE subunit